MPEPTTGDLIQALKDAFHWYPLPEKALAWYAVELSDIPPAVLEQAIREVIRTETKYFPSIGLIRSVAAARMLALPSPTGALAQVQARITWAKTVDEEERSEPPEVHPTVKQALELVGGYGAFRTAEESTIVRGQFLRLYKELREDTLHDAAAGRLALPPAA